MVLSMEWNAADIKTKIVKNDYTLTSDGFWLSLFATNAEGHLFGFEAQSMSFKSPSEHTIDGNRYDLEIQILHSIKKEFNTFTRDKAILSIMFQIDETSVVEFFNTFNPNTLNTDFLINPKNSLAKFIDENPVYYTYLGSMTTPNCEESVNWYVLQKPLGITSANLKKFTQYWGDNLSFSNGEGNNRPISSLGTRTIMQGGVQCEEQFVYFFSFFILYIFINYFIFKLL